MRKKRRKRVILLFVVTFLITLTVGLSGVVIYHALQNRQTQDTFSEREIATGEGSVTSGDAAGEKAGEDNGAGKSEQADQEMAESDDAVTEDGEMQPEDGSAESDGLSAEENGAAETEPLQEIITDEIGQATLVFGGDICFHDPYANMGSYVQRGSDIRNCISEVLLSEMQNADVCMVNNEFSYSDRGAPLEGKTYTFRSKPENVGILHDMGVDIVSVANNHAYDYGPQAFLDTLQTLDDAGVYHVGGGENLDKASQPVYFTIENLKIGYVSATQIERTDSPDTKGATENTPGVLRCFSESELSHFLDVIQRAKEECDFLVVFVHWGTENTDAADWAQPYQAERIAQAGADLIVGCHPHCLQGVTQFAGVPVVYSLGNFWFNSKTMDTALLKAVVGKDGLESLQIIAARQENCSTRELTGDESARVLSYLQGLSPEVTIGADGSVIWQ